MSFSCTAGRSRGFFAAAGLLAAVALGGCSTVSGWMNGTPPAPLSAGLPDRGQPVPSAAAKILESAPAGAKFDYPVMDGHTTPLVLGAIYQSGLAVPCRMARVNSGEGVGDSPTVYAFCRQGDTWFEMRPVVVSGY